MGEPTHREIFAELAVLKEKAHTNEADHAMLKNQIDALRRDLRAILLEEAETRGTWAGIRIGARLAMFAIGATAGAGIIKIIDWTRHIFD